MTRGQDGWSPKEFEQYAGTGYAGYVPRSKVGTIVLGSCLGLFATFLLAIMIIMVYDYAVLSSRGKVVTGQVLQVHRGRHTTATVRFTTANGQEIITDIGPVAYDTEPGDILVRYDPADPAGRVQPANGAETITYVTLVGLLFAAIAAFGGWTLWQWVTRRRVSPGSRRSGRAAQVRSRPARRR